MQRGKYSRRGTLLGGAAWASGLTLSMPAEAATPYPFDKPNMAVQGTGGYRTMGVGGGGAMGSPAFSPHENLWFVGTDMGTLFVSRTSGASWEAVHNFQTAFQQQVGASLVGFATKPQIVLHSIYDPNFPGLARRSVNGGGTFSWIAYDFAKDRILYWYPVLNGGGIVFAGGEKGLFRSSDDGASWQPVAGLSGRSVGTFANLAGPTPVLFHATDAGVFRSGDLGKSFKPVWQASLSGFAGGFDAHGQTLAAIAPAPPSTARTTPILWLATGDGPFKPTAPTQPAGDFVRMADNNSQVIYVTGGEAWPKETGTTVWVSEDGGAKFDKRFLQYDWSQNPYAPWPADKLEYSAVGLDIGWSDNGYHGFAVAQHDAKLAGGTGNYFFHVTVDTGNHWRAPFTAYAESGPNTARKAGQRWRSRGLEVTSIRSVRFHPADLKFGIAVGCDNHTLVTADGGDTWTVRRGPYNTVYDVALDPATTGRLFGAMGDAHDWGHWGNYAPLLDTKKGGAFVFDRSTGQWAPVDTQGFALDYQCLSILYDDKADELYVGTQGLGIAHGRVKGGGWRWINDGFVGPSFVVPQLALDPVTRDVYALLSASLHGDKGGSLIPENAASTGIHRLNRTTGKWEVLRKSVQVPDGRQQWKDKLLGYPTSFAIDWRGAPGKRALYMTDIEAPFGVYRGTGLWRAYENDLTWQLVLQHQGAYHVQLENGSDAHAKSSRVYLSGELNSLQSIQMAAESPGNFGALYSDSWGDVGSWKRNDAFPLQAHLWSTTPSPHDANEVIYTCFGGGMYRGPRPA
ncbi:MAG TPA: hypothetical protein VMI56_27110 [Reyranella sp.]|nr:hypothetical protein [Reyranella sp.]